MKRDKKQSSDEQAQPKVKRNNLGSHKGQQSPNTGHKRDKLSVKYQMLITRYMTHWNGRRAAIEVGIPEASAASTASIILKKPAVVAEMDRRLAEMKMGENEVLARISQHARATIEPFMDEMGKIDLTSDSAKDNLHMVKKAKTKTRRIDGDDTTTELIDTEIEVHDSAHALDALGKHYGLFIDKSASGDQVYQQHMQMLREAIQGKTTVNIPDESDEDEE